MLSSRHSEGASLSLLLITLLFSLTATAGLTPHSYKFPHPHVVTNIEDEQPIPPLQIISKGFKNIAYYVNWAIYARNFPPQNIQSQPLTHIFYAFASLSNETGTVSLSDPFADIEKRFPTDNADDTSTENLYGNLKQLYLQKKKNRNLKTLLSIGGWTFRDRFGPALEGEEGRREFVRSSVELLKDLGFDGIDIDWEYPSSTQESHNLVETCRLMREALDTYSLSIGGNPHFLLALAVPAGPQKFPFFDLPALSPYVDFLNLMGYDYQGGFSDFSGHQANVYKSLRNPKSTEFSTQDAVDYYLAAENGWERERLNLGMPIYGRGFDQTDGPGREFEGVGEGSWEGGVWDYKAIINNSTFGLTYYDPSIVASFTYNHTSRYMVSFDDPWVVRQKAEYIQFQGMGGAMWWELSGDMPLESGQSLIGNVGEVFEGYGGLEWSWNCLEYPFSRYANLREGMREE